MYKFVWINMYNTYKYVLCACMTMSCWYLDIQYVFINQLGTFKIFPHNEVLYDKL